MKRTLVASTAAAALLAAPAWAARDSHETHHVGEGAAQLAQAAGPTAKGQGMGPGMMGQQGMGPGMMGQQGMGPGTMGQQGMNPGMMGQQGMNPGMMGQQGMGPGMMGQQGMNPGMMGQQGMGHGMMGGMMGPGMMGGMMGQGMGPGMMGGMMGQGMGPGMMGGMMGRADPYAALDLSSEQRSKIANIQQDLWRKQWDLMGKMHEGRFHMHQFYVGAETDDGEVRKAYQAMADAHKQMFEAMLDGRKRVDAVLTDEQRKKLQRGG